MAIRIKIQLVILSLFLIKSTVQCWSSYDHNMRHHHHRSRNTNNIVNKQLTKVNKQQVHGFIETTTTSNVNNVNKQQQIFPCDNFICLLETFELLKTESGFLFNELLLTSSENLVNSGSRCSDFECWFSQA